MSTIWSHLGHKIQITLRIFFLNRIAKEEELSKKYIKINKKKAPIFRLGLFEFGAGNETRTRDPNLGKVNEIFYINLYSIYLFDINIF